MKWHVSYKKRSIKPTMLARIRKKKNPTKKSGINEVILLPNLEK